MKLELLASKSLKLPEQAHLMLVAHSEDSDKNVFLNTLECLDILNIINY